MPTGATRTAEGRGRFGIGTALAVSVVLHLLLLVVSWLFPPQAHSMPPVAEETTLRFDLTPVEPAEESVEPKGQVPIPTAEPQPPAQETAPDPTPMLDEFVSEPAPTDFPPPPVEPQEAVVEEVAEVESAEESQSGLDLPGDGVESEGETETSRSAREAARAQEPFNMEDALQDFGRALRQPQPGADGSKKGMNIPDLPPLPPTGFGFGNLEFESRDYDWSDYARQIYMVIWRAWHNRLYATADEFERWGFANRSFTLRHANRVSFTIQANGQIAGIVLETPSGCYPLDDSATDALTEVILQPLPRDFPRGQETVHARFIAEGDVRTMRRYLGQLKRAGYF